jgi:hypothetical protein
MEQEDAGRAAALRHRHEDRRAVRPCQRLGELDASTVRRGAAHVLHHHTTANALVADIHDRMPVILPPEAYERWLANIEPDLRDLLVPFPSEQMMMWPMSTRVNKPDNDDPSILHPVERGSPTLL